MLQENFGILVQNFRKAEHDLELFDVQGDWNGGVANKVILDRPFQQILVLFRHFWRGQVSGTNFDLAEATKVSVLHPVKISLIFERFRRRAGKVSTRITLLFKRINALVKRF